ncbi:MAG TPA: hypothetical protein VHB69_09860 [Mycobacteriales bacterium]|nr:hypothetical protein [Mycobacteriales bacterium]
MTSEVGRPAWQARYPDLAGKVAVIAGTASVLKRVGTVLSDNGVLCAVVVDDRGVVDEVVQHADAMQLKSMGIVADPTQLDTWERVRPHIEQRLGPIDIGVVIAPPAARALMLSALLPDMAARRRGVLVEAGSVVERLDMPDGVRHRGISGGSGFLPTDLAAVVALCASDVLMAPTVMTRLDG